MARGMKHEELNISVTMKIGECRRTISYDISKMKLPVTLSAEGLVLEVKQNGKSNGAKAKPDPNRVKGRGAKNTRTVEITLPDTMNSKSGQPTFKVYGVLNVPKEVRRFFPPYKADFVIRSPRGEFVVCIAAARNEDTSRYRGQYISKGCKKLLEAHSDLQPGDTLVFRKNGQVQVDGKPYQCYDMTVRAKN